MVPCSPCHNPIPLVVSCPDGTAEGEGRSHLHRRGVDLPLLWVVNPDNAMVFQEMKSKIEAVRKSQDAHSDILDEKEDVLDEKEGILQVCRL